MRAQLVIAVGTSLCDTPSTADARLFQEYEGVCRHLGGCQNYGPFLGTLNIGCRIIIWTQKGTIILTTTHL